MVKSDVTTVEEVTRILDEQQAFFDTGKTKDLDFRISELKKLKKLVKDHEDDIMEALNKDLGKSQFEGFITEIGVTLSSIDKVIKNVKEWAKPKRVSAAIKPSKNYLIHEPYGSVLIIGPFNYPFHLLIEPLVGAIAAGNCAVLKPSEQTPAVSALVKRMFVKEFSPNYVRVVEGEAETSQALTSAPFDYIFFTGSTNVGKKIMEAAAKHLTPVTLELGGKSPTIIDKDANIEHAAERIVWGKFLNNGQTCIAPDYIYVHEDVKKPLIEQVKKVIKQFYGKKDIQNNPDYGRIVNQAHFERLSAMIDSDRAHLIYGGEQDESTRYIGPTLLDIPSRDAASMQEEIFGPILPIMTFTNLNEVVKDVKKQPKPLALYFFGDTKESQDFVMNDISFGGGCINDTVMHLQDDNLPFGGVGPSGMGNYHGVYSFETFSHKKAVANRSTRFKMKMMYPPFGNKINQVKRFFK